MLGKDQLSPIYVALPPADIVYLKFILESYEGLGIVRTLDAEKAEIVILATDDTKDIVAAVLAELSTELALSVIDEPASKAGDWLLAEE